MKKLGLGSEVDLHVSEVPVEYQTVQSLVPSLWKQYRPLVRGAHDVTYSYYSNLKVEYRNSCLPQFQVRSDFIATSFRSV